MEKISFNQYDYLPFIPYKIIEALSNDVEADNIFKLLYYPTYDALSEPSLTFEQKMDLIWCNNDSEQDYKIFLKPLVSNEITESMTQMRLFKCDIDPQNQIISTLSYQFDFIIGSKIAMVDYKGIPCPRIDVLEMEILKALNGRDDLGVGFFQFNTSLSRLDRERMTMSNGKTFFGHSLIMSVLSSSIEVGDSCG